MSTWSKSPLFTRKEEKNDTLLHLADREDRLKKRVDEISAIGAQVHGLLKVFICLLDIIQHFPHMTNLQLTTFITWSKLLKI